MDAIDTLGTANTLETGTAHLLVGNNFVRLVFSGDISADTISEITETVDGNCGLRLAGEIRCASHNVSGFGGSGVNRAMAARLPQRPKVLRAPETVAFLLEITGVDQLVDLIP